ncbi:SDR family NAD(P)-dependent oxidoreductase [Devosia sp. A449]
MKTDATGLFDLTGEVALVTGAAQGLGLGMAQALAAAGAHVIINDQDEERAVTAANELCANGWLASPSVFDVADRDATQAAIASVNRTVGDIAIVVNNAGYNIRKPFEDYTPEDARALMDVHYFGAMNVTQAALPGMKRLAFGRIIMIGSITTDSTRVPMSCYAAAKGAVTALTRALAMELGPLGITTNMIAPGYFSTPMSRIFTQDPEYLAYIKDRTPVRRWGQPEDLASTVLYLASPASDFLNGQVIALNGGILHQI